MLTLKMHRLYQLFRSKMAIPIRSMKVKSESSIIKRIQAISKGFTVDKLNLYNFDEYQYDQYLSDYERAKSRFINDEYSIILSNKILFSELIANKVNTPKLIGKVLKGHYFSNLSDNKITEELEKDNKLVFKPYVDSDDGQGVFILEKIKNKYYIDRSVVSFVQIIEKIKKLDEYMVTPFIEQGNFTKKFFPDTLNTIRVLTMYNKESNSVNIAATILRVGTLKSYPVDNWTSGGLSINIDKVTGRLSTGKIKGLDDSFYSHPDTEYEFYDEQIPDWEIHINKIKKMALDLSYIPYIGWDIVLTEDGILVLEGNNCSAVDFIQAHEPLLLDKKNKEFYSYQNIIKRN